MKTLALAIIAAFVFVGCETVELDDGSRTTRFDAAAFNSAADTAGKIYDRYRTSQPSYTAPVRQPTFNPYTGLYQ